MGGQWGCHDLVCEAKHCRHVVADDVCHDISASQFHHLLVTIRFAATFQHVDRLQSVSPGDSTHLLTPIADIKTNRASIARYPASPTLIYIHA